MAAESHGYTSPRTFAEQNTCSNLSSRLRPRFTAALISYELFERCASILNGAPITFSQLRTANVFRQSAILDRRRHSSAVEQLFRKQQVLGSNPSVGSTISRTSSSAVLGFGAMRTRSDP